MAATAPPALRQRCLHELASSLVAVLHGSGAADDGDDAAELAAGVAALPQELRLVLLLLLAGWQLLDDAAVEALVPDSGTAGADAAAGSVLVGPPAVSLASCALLGAAGVRRLLCGPLPALRTLSLKGVLALTDAEVALVAAHCPGLRCLDLSNCLELTPRAVHAVAASPAGPRLEALSLAGCWQVAALPGLTACTALTCLSLGGCWQLSEAAVREVLACTPELVELCLAGCVLLGSGVLVDGARLVAPFDKQLPPSADGVVLPQLRTLDVSGTLANDSLLVWVAQFCCGRLQRLNLAGCSATGTGVAAVLRAKCALLACQRCACRRWRGAPGAGEVLPLLELSAAGVPVAGPRCHTPNHPLAVHFPGGGGARCAAGGSGGEAAAPLLLDLAAPPADAGCLLCQPTATGAARAGELWPPDFPADVLRALGPEGLAALQALDMDGPGANALAEVVALCTSLRRLRLAGCTSLGDGSLAAVLKRLPDLRALDVSGCRGSRYSQPGSQFQRHKAPRLQLGGVTDDSLRLFGRHAKQAAQQPAEWQPPPASAHSPGVGGAAASQTPGPCTAVPSLNASDLSITDATLCSLAQLQPAVSSLQLRRCKRVTDAGLLQLLSAGAGLARLDVMGCSQVSAGGFGCHLPFDEDSKQAPSSPAACAAGTATSNGNGDGWPAAQNAQLALWRRVVSTAPGVRLQRAALPKRACTREVLAWLTGRASSSAVAAGVGGRWPAGFCPLQRLELASCARLAEADLLALAACCPQLKSLSLGPAGMATGALCAALSRHCRRLSRLALRGAPRLADADVAVLLAGLPALQHLELTGCHEVTGSAFKAHGRREGRGGGEGAPRLALRTLRLDECRVRDEGAAAAAAACPHLTHLSLCRSFVSGAAAVAALTSCANLRQLSLGATNVGPVPALWPAGVPSPGALQYIQLPECEMMHCSAWMDLVERHRRQTGLFCTALLCDDPLG